MQYDWYEFFDVIGGVLGLKVEWFVFGEWFFKDYYCVCVCVDYYLYYKENKKFVKWIKNRFYLICI